MRLFVAVELGERERTALASAAEACRERIGELQSSARVSWVPRERLHITVRFIGRTDEATAAAVTRALSPALLTQRFEIDFDGIGVFPPTGRLRVLWVGVGHGAERLVAVEHEVGRRLSLCGLLPDTSAYHPHVTLGRIREPAGLRGPALLRGLPGPERLRMSVDAITLFESRTSPQGASYRPLLRTTLARRA